MQTCLRRRDIWVDNGLGILQLDGTLETAQPKHPNKIWNPNKNKNECQVMDAIRILRNEIEWM